MGALAIASIATTITRAKVFRWLRVWIADKSEFWGDLFSCPYCFTHWLSIAYILLCQQEVCVTATGFWWLDGIVSIFAVVTAAAVVINFGLLPMFDKSEHDTLQRSLEASNAQCDALRTSLEQAKTALQQLAE